MMVMMTTMSSKFKVRYLKPKESSFSVVEASSVYEAINDFHFENAQGLWAFRRDKEGKVIERVVYAICEALDEEGRRIIESPVRMFRTGIMRRGGIKNPSERTEEQIAEELGIEKDILHQEWYLEEQYP